MSGKYKIRLHRAVVEEDSKQFSQATKEKIKDKVKKLLSNHPNEVGAPLRYELSGYRKLKIFNKYRIVYRVDEEEIVVFVLAVGIRRDEEVYNKAKKRLRA